MRVWLSRIRELFLYAARYDVQLVAAHRAGALLVRADALSRMHCSESHRQWVCSDEQLKVAKRVRVLPEVFALVSEL